MSPWPTYRMPSCMGAWACPLRASCAHYHAEDRRAPEERLCPPGTRDAYTPLIRRLEHAAEYHMLAAIHGVTAQ